MQQDERSSRVKSSLRKLQETKTKLDSSYESAGGLPEAESNGRLSVFKNDFKEFNLKIQQATTVSMNYVGHSNEVKSH